MRTIENHKQWTHYVFLTMYRVKNRWMFLEKTFTEIFFHYWKLLCQESGEDCWSPLLCLLQYIAHCSSVEILPVRSGVGQNEEKCDCSALMLVWSVLVITEDKQQLSKCWRTTHVLKGWENKLQENEEGMGLIRRWHVSDKQMSASWIVMVFLITCSWRWWKLLTSPFVWLYSSLQPTDVSIKELDGLRPPFS